MYPASQTLHIFYILSLTVYIVIGNPDSWCGYLFTPKPTQSQHFFRKYLTILTNNINTKTYFLHISQVQENSLSSDICVGYIMI